MFIKKKKKYIKIYWNGRRRCKSSQLCPVNSRTRLYRHYSSEFHGSHTYTHTRMGSVETCRSLFSAGSSGFFWAEICSRCRAASGIARSAACRRDGVYADTLRRATPENRTIRVQSRRHETRFAVKLTGNAYKPRAKRNVRQSPGCCSSSTGYRSVRPRWCVPRLTDFCTLTEKKRKKTKGPTVRNDHY